MHIPHALVSRIRHILLIIFCAIGTIIVYLFHLQISQSHFFNRLSKQNYLRTEKIAPLRGIITDQHGTALVTNRPVYSVFWDGSGNRQLTFYQQACARHTISLSGLNDAVLYEIEKAERFSRKILLASDISFESLCKLFETMPASKNITVKEHYERCYPYGITACHIIGYLSTKNATQGKMGLERLYEEDLKGQAGQVIKITNAIGNHLQAHTISQALAGKTLTTTLDLPLQLIAEEVFPADYEGSLIFMDEDGALKVVLSRPSFDPGMFLKSMSKTTWNLLLEKNGFVNRALGACYPPASLFKLVTLAAGIETGIITPHKVWDCKGYTDFKGRDYHCNNNTVHGSISTKQAFALSCNMPFYEIGKRISIDTLASYARELGLGCKTGIAFPEQYGLVPTTHWKKRVRHEPWWPGETLSAAIGQSSLLVTPLQIACLMSAVCTGYRIKPRILFEEPVSQEILSIKQSTLSYVQECLQSVISHGTGASLSTLEGFTIKGKSGTAQVRSRSTEVIRRKDMPHGYFAARVQYRHEKPHTLVVFIEHAGSSKYAVRTAYKFLSRYGHWAHKSSKTSSK